MTAGLEQRQPGRSSRLLDRLMIWGAALLVVAVAAFGIYYYLGQQGPGEATPRDHQISQLEQDVRANPQDIGSRVVLAELYYTEQRYDDSVEQFRAALTIEEQSVVALVGLGRALVAVGDGSGAIVALQKVVDVTEESDIPGELAETARYYLGRVYLDQEQLGEAIANLEQAVAIDRADADAWYLLGEAYVKNGDLDEAIRALSQAVAFVPDFTEAYEQMAIAYDLKGLLPESQYARGMLAYSQGRYDEAEIELEAAVNASATLVQGYIGLGLVRETQGQRELALNAYEDAFQLEPDNFNVRAGLTRLGALTPGSTPVEEDAP